MPTQRLITVSINEADIDLIRHIESAKIVNNAPAVGFDPNGHALPFSREEARELLDSEGYATAIFEVPLECFEQAMAEAGSVGVDDVYDTLHEIAFGGFGVSEDSCYEVLGAAGQSSGLIVRYTTRLHHFFVGEPEETAYPSFH